MLIFPFPKWTLQAGALLSLMPQLCLTGLLLFVRAQIPPTHTCVTIAATSYPLGGAVSIPSVRSGKCRAFSEITTCGVKESKVPFSDPTPRFMACEGPQLGWEWAAVGLALGRHSSTCSS